ncbi:MAG: siphovirus Gp157 family protein, partial [Microcystaceae cyanobacterium]
MQAPTQTPPTETLNDLERELELILHYLESEAPEDRQVAEEVFRDFLPRLEKKIDGYVAAIQRLKARQDLRQAEANRIAALAKSDCQTVTWLTQKLQDFMENRVAELGERKGKKLEGLYCRISLCNN